MRELGNKIRTCGRNQNRVCITREVDMRHAIGNGLVPELGQTGLPVNACNVAVPTNLEAERVITA